MQTLSPEAAPTSHRCTLGCYKRDPIKSHNCKKPHVESFFGRPCHSPESFLGDSGWPLLEKQFKVSLTSKTALSQAAAAAERDNADPGGPCSRATLSRQTARLSSADLQVAAHHLLASIPTMLCNPAQFKTWDCPSTLSKGSGRLLGAQLYPPPRHSPCRESYCRICTSSTHSAGNQPVRPFTLPSQKPPSPMLSTVGGGGESGH